MIEGVTTSRCGLPAHSVDVLTIGSNTLLTSACAREVVNKIPSIAVVALVGNTKLEVVNAHDVLVSAVEVADSQILVASVSAEVN